MYRIKIGKYTSQKANRKKGDDTWYYKFQKPGFNKNGGRLYAYKAGFATKLEAENAAEKDYIEIYGVPGTSDRCVDRSISNMTFEAYVEHHWWKVAETMIKQGTIKNYKKYFKNQLFPQFGKIPLCNLSHEILQNYFNKLYIYSGMSVNSIDNLRTLMSQVLKFACNNRHLDYNPMSAVHKPNLRISAAVTRHEQVRDAISDEILDKIADRFPEGTPAYLPFSLCLHAGLRLAEAFGLAWSDIDFENHCIYVTRQFQRRERMASPTYYEQKLIKKHPALDKEIWCTCDPKYNSKRVIPMSSRLEEILKSALKRQKYYRAILKNKYKKYYYTRELEPTYFSDFESFITSKSKSEYEDGIVNLIGIGYEIDFINRYEDGSVVTESTLKHLSRVVQGKENEPAIYQFYNNHSLRHTFASKLRASGVEEHVVQALLGHKSTKETKTYLHITAKEYTAVSLSMNGTVSKMDALAKMIQSHNLNDEQLEMLIAKLKSEN